MNILYVAYSCSPDYGSEDAIGWNIPLEAIKKGNDVTVIVRSGEKSSIMEWIKDHPNEKFPKFYFIETNKLLTKIAKGPLYTLRLYDFAFRTLNLLKKLNKEKKFDIIHQITPVEFRSIGNYGKIPNIKYVVGPIAGGQKINPILWKYVYKKDMEKLRVLINNFIIKTSFYKRKLKCIDTILFANEETRDYFKEHGLALGNEITIPEIGVKNLRQSRENYIYKKNKIPVFLMVGRLISIKGFDIVLDSLKYLKNKDFKIRICGEGKLYRNFQKKIKDRKLSEIVELVGFVDYHRMEKEYRNASVLIMPSLREATGTVLIEAMSHGVPVITFDQFGAHLIIDEQSGWLIPVNDTLNKCIIKLADIMEEVINNPKEAEIKGACAAEKILKYTWEEKFNLYENIYINLIKKEKI